MTIQGIKIWAPDPKVVKPSSNICYWDIKDKNINRDRDMRIKYKKVYRQAY